MMQGVRFLVVLVGLLAPVTGAAHSIGHMGDPDNIAWAVVWLASDGAKFVTGAEIVIDGGA